MAIIKCYFIRVTWLSWAVRAVRLLNSCLLYFLCVVFPFVSFLLNSFVCFSYYSLAWRLATVRPSGLFLCLFHIHSFRLISTLTVYLSYFIVAISMRKCLGKHSWMSSTFPISILSGRLTFIFIYCLFRCCRNLLRCFYKKVLLRIVKFLLVSLVRTYSRTQFNFSFPNKAMRCSDWFRHGWFDSSKWGGGFFAPPTARSMD